MKQLILSLILVTTFTCKIMETPRGYPNVYRCENDEVVCYMFHTNGIFCKFKENQDENR